ncbi:MAG TPA: sigma-70 family RNA polymerase sigma factor [Thermoanaerobaculia bacterium]|jgi:RNA polymerase sigma factor for flagellar operon FliA|nr:sigma-70 family RNA polymerase sigma factor [Thermoanaerobaculia bacterium]
MNPEMTYLQHLESIERIAAYVARRGHLNPDETGEFVQIVRVRLFEDDYGVIRKFEGRSSFSTYLTTVILRLFHQWRVEMWGKWRPSAEAKRLGDKAITLERLMTRDGYTFAEAVKVLTTRAGDDFTVPELEAIYVRLPLRTPRPMLVSDEMTPDIAATDGDADDRVECRDRERAARCCATTLDAALARFDAEDRLILQLRFWDNRKVPDIARIVGIDQKKIYKRLEKLFGVLRQALEAANICRAEVDKILDRRDQEIHLDLLSEEEIAALGPSHPSGEDRVRGGGGGL